MPVTLPQPTVAQTKSYSPDVTTDRIALIDSSGTIIAVNKHWSDLTNQTRTGSNHTGPGVNYLDVCRRASSFCADARDALIGIRSVLKKRSSSFVMDYGAYVHSSPAHFRMVATPFSLGEAVVAVVHVDITELYLSGKQSLERIHELGRRIINTKEEERERIAREIHDDLGNRIALLSFSIHSLVDHHHRHDLRVQQLVDVQRKITELSYALRDLSHSIHPHLLQRFGICAALKVLCDEFKKNGRIQIDAKVPEELLDLSKEGELCIFRVLQECLQNIVKHSQATTASILLERRPKQIRMIVADNGRGFLQSEAWQKGGLGLTSMRERVLCMQGQLEVRSSPGAGTKVQLTIPVGK